MNAYFRRLLIANHWANLSEAARALRLPLDTVRGYAFNKYMPTERSHTAFLLAQTLGLTVAQLRAEIEGAEYDEIVCNEPDTDFIFEGRNGTRSA